MKDAPHHLKKLQKKILRETKKELNGNGKSKEGVVAMASNYTNWGINNPRP